MKFAGRVRFRGHEGAEQKRSWPERGKRVAGSPLRLPAAVWRLQRRLRGKAEPSPEGGADAQAVPGGTAGLRTYVVPEAPAILARNLLKRFGDGPAAVEALRGVNITFERASFNAIMGPSGSGKSTLMHLLAGLDRPSAGSVEIGGVAIAELGDGELTALRRQQVGFVFQAFNLMATLDAEENIALPLRLAGETPDAAWMEALLRAVDLSDYRGQRPSELSGGQQQRVAIARALVARPSVIFADEPTGNLDSASSEEILLLLRRAVDQFGQTVVMVTHDPAAAAHADRIVSLADGRIVNDRVNPDHPPAREPPPVR